MSLFIITGMSGAGKSQAIDALEDIGFYCIDNLPPQFLAPITTLSKETATGKNLAIVIDSRSREMFAQFENEIQLLKKQKVDFKLIFIDCSDEELLNRYKETRRKHPLMDSNNNSLESAIERERKMISSARNDADYIIDTTFTTAKRFRQQLMDIIGEAPLSRMQIKLVSFGYKFGIPSDADIVFDVRCLPNPFYIPELKHKTGLDQEVYDYVFSFEEARKIAAKLLDLLQYAIPMYLEEGKTQLVIALGCTGGKHRSISFVRYLAEELKFPNISVITSHRDFDRKD